MQSRITFDTQLKIALTYYLTRLQIYDNDSRTFNFTYYLFYWGLLRSFNSVLADWNDLSPTTKKLSLRDFKNTLRKTFM